MPDLEPCSECGRQVLISRYSWNKREVICQACKDSNIQSKTYERLNQSVSINSSEKLIPPPKISAVERKPSTALSSKRPPDEILVTWTSLLKISFGIFFIAVLLIVGIMSRKNNDETFPTDRIQSLKTNILQKTI